jgi:pimeloyl-ACP methyl ester carboxylesterase
MPLKQILFTIFLAILCCGCIPKQPTKTVRPQIDTGPWQEKTITSETTGATYQYQFIASPSESAPALLLLPGGFFDNRIWYYLDGLSKYFHIYALNWPDDSEFYTGNLADYNNVVVDFLQSIGVTDLVMGGVSAGSYAAIESTLKNKEIRVKALILFSAVMLSITPKEVKTRIRRAKFILRLKPDKLRSLVEYKVKRTTFDKAPGDVQQPDIFYVRPYSYYYQLFQTIKNQRDKKQATLEITCPTLILHGTADEIMPIELARLSTPQFKNATFVEFKDYKHAMVFNHGPEFIPPIVRFLETCDLAPPMDPSPY